ncbi:MAG: hypothetical protein U9O65_10690 [Thermotogota bacterium]|nr:hypothetical protein [Thermotogota bacterium]
MKKVFLYLVILVIPLSFAFGWDYLDIDPLLLNYDGTTDWSLGSSELLNSILSMEPYNLVKSYGLSVDKDELKELTDDELYRLILIRADNKSYPLLINSDGFVVKDEQNLELLYSVLTGKIPNPSEITALYNSSVEMVDSLVTAIRPLTYGSRKSLTDKAFRYLNRINYDTVKSLIDYAYTREEDYWKLALYDTANILLERIEFLDNVLTKNHRTFVSETNKTGSLNAIKAMNEIELVYHEIKSIYEEVNPQFQDTRKENLININNTFKTSKINRLIVRDKGTLIQELMEEPEGLVNLFEPMLEKHEKIGDFIKAFESMKVAIQKLPKLVVSPKNKSVVFLEDKKSITLMWRYVYPTTKLPVYTIKYSEVGKKPQSFTTTSNSMSIRLSPFKEYLWSITVDQEETHEFVFNTLEMLPELKITNVKPQNPVRIEWTAYDKYDPEYVVKIPGVVEEECTKDNYFEQELPENKEFRVIVNVFSIDGMKVDIDGAEKDFYVPYSYPLIKPSPTGTITRGLTEFSWELEKKVDVNQYIFKLKGPLNTIRELNEQSTKVNLEDFGDYQWTVDVVTDKGRLSNLDSSGETMYWEVTLENDLPDIDMEPAGTIVTKEREITVNVSVEERDGDEVEYGIEKSIYPDFSDFELEGPRTGEKKFDDNFQVGIPIGRDYYIRAFADDGYDRVYSNVLRITGKYSWIGNSRPGDEPATTYILNWDVKDLVFKNFRFKVVLSEKENPEKPIELLTSNKQITVKDLKPHTEYNWYIVLLKTNGREELFPSPVWSFKTANRKPYVEFLSPEEGKAVNPLTGSISWETTDPDGDRIIQQKITVREGEKILFNELIDPDANSFKFSEYGLNLDENKIYRCEITATDSLGARSDTKSKEFITSLVTPTIDIIMPEKGTTVNPDDVVVDVKPTDVKTAELTYKVYLNGDLVLTEYEPGFVLPPEEILGHNEYLLELKIVDEHGLSSTSTVSFKTMNRTPEAPEIVKPENTEEPYDLKKGISWKCSDRDGDELSYRVTITRRGDKYLSLDTNKTFIEPERMPELKGNRTYDITIEALDEYGGISSKTTTIEQINTPPSIELFELEAEFAQQGQIISVKTDYFDRDGDELTAILYVKNQDGSLIEDYELDKKQFTVELPERGIYIFELEVTDEYNGKTTEIKELPLLNRRPLIEIFEHSIEKGETGYALTVNLEIIDPDGDEVIVSGQLKGDDVSRTPKIKESQQQMKQKFQVVFTGLKGHSKYEVFIEVYDSPPAAYVSKSSKVSSLIETPNSPPEVISYSVIKDEEGFVDYNEAKFVWNVFDFDGDEVNSEIEIYKGETSKGKLYKSYTTDETSYTATDLEPHEEYYWRVIARDNYNAVFSTDFKRFVTLNNRPEIDYSITFEGIYPVVSIDSNDVDGDLLQYEVKLFDGEKVIYETKTEKQEITINSENLTGHHYYLVEVSVTDVLSATEKYAKRSSVEKEIKTPNRDPVIKEFKIVDTKGRDVTSERLKGITRYPVFSWMAEDPDGDDISYKLAVVNTSTDEIVAESPLTNDTAYSVRKMLKGHTQYKVTLIAQDNFDGETATSVLFETENAPPSIASLINPKPGVEEITSVPEFVWKAEDPDCDALRYQLYVWKDDEKEPEVPFASTNNSNYELSNKERLKGHSLYYWKVIARDNFGGSDSETATFTTRNGIPSVENIEISSQATNNVPASVWVKWIGYDPDGDSLTYTVELKNITEERVTIKENLEEEMTVFSNLKGHSKYEVIVYAEDEFGGINRNSKYFETKNKIPITRLQVPEIMDSGFVKIHWKSFDYDGDELEQLITISDISTDKQVFSDSVNTKSLILPFLPGNRKYRVEIKTTDGFGGMASDEAIFYVGNTKPGTPRAFSPADGSKVRMNFDTFSWRANDLDNDDLSYDLILENVFSGESLRISRIHSETMHFNFLTPFTLYRWRIVVNDGYDGSSDGGYWYFLTDGDRYSLDGERYISIFKDKILGKDFIMLGTTDGRLVLFNEGDRITRFGEINLFSSGLKEISYFENKELLEKLAVDIPENIKPITIRCKSDFGTEKVILITDLNDLVEGRNLFIYDIE